MGTNSPGTPKKCRLILQQCLAIQLTKPGSPPEDFWMYDSGYTIFQNFLSANLQCWWNAPLAAATKVLKYLGHIAPGMLLITAEPCALEIIRSAYARSVLKPPATYLISSVGDIDDCIVTPIVQTQFTPLTEALCDVIMELTSQGQSATIENIRNRLRSRFTHMQQPSVEVIYDTLVQLMQEIKIYQTSKGYFIVTPEKRRYKSNGTGLEYGFAGELNGSAGSNGSPGAATKESKTLLMSSHEALSSLYGEISTERAGDQTHQCIQTNLADVICGGNPNDKILYARPNSSSGSSSSKIRSSSFPSNGKTLERRHSLRFFGSSKRLQRSASTRSLSKNYAQTIGKDGTVGTNGGGPTSGTGTMPQGGSIGGSTAVGGPGPESSLDAAKKQASSQSLLSRIFRRSTRSKSKSKQIETYSAQFPPPEWFNSKTTHLHSVGTQTTDYLDFPIKSRLLNSTFYDSSDVSQRSLSLPRRRHHHRRNLSSESTFFISSRDCSPVRRGKSPASGSSYYCGSLPRSIHSTPGSSSYYKSSTRSSTKQLASSSSSNSQPKMEHHQHHGTSRSNNTSRNPGPASGPSSIDSGKMTYATTTSGPSSFDSEKLSSTRTSTHSSLESHVSSSTITTAIQQQQQQQQQQSSSGGPGSPSAGSTGQQASPSRVSMEAKANGGTVTTVLTAVASTTKSNNNSNNNSSISNGYKRYETTFGYTSSGAGSVGSATRRTTPSTNTASPTTPPSTGGHRLSLTKPIDHLAALSESLLQFRLNGDSLNGTGAPNRNDGTGLPPSDGSGTRKTTKTTTTTAVIRTVPIAGPPQDHTTGTVPANANGQPEQNRYNKNSTMNNSKVMPPMQPAAGVPPVQPPNFFYKNVLKNIQHDSKNFCGDLAIEKTRYGEEGGLYELPPCNTNLRRSNSEIKKLNSNHDPPLKNHTDELLSSSPKYNGSAYHHQQQHQQQQQQQQHPHLGGSVQAPQSTLQPSQLSGLIVMKKSLSVSSEPNLLANGGDKGRSQQITIMVKENAGGAQDTGNESDGPVGKRSGGGAPVIGLDRRFSFQSNRPTDEPPELLEEMYEFPSLSDLSFNFTSLAAQKILQGDASLNSIDTLVELNINQEKQQTLMRLKSDACLLAAKTAAVNATTTDEPLGDTGGKVMTDFGMV